MSNYTYTHPHQSLTTDLWVSIQGVLKRIHNAVVPCPTYNEAPLATASLTPNWDSTPTNYTK